MNNRKEIHERVLNASNIKELCAAYGEWASDYDADLLENMEYVAPMLTWNLLKAHLNGSDLHILDAGCGTGIVGELMHGDGYTMIEGLDYSQEMLCQAQSKHIYRTLFQADLTSRLDIASKTYDAIISVGTFTCGHVGPDSLMELIRIAKPEGLICFTVREKAWEEDAYEKVLQNMEDQGVWSRIIAEKADYIRQEGSSCYLCLFRRA